MPGPEQSGPGSFFIGTGHPGTSDAGTLGRQSGQLQTPTGPQSPLAQPREHPRRDAQKRHRCPHRSIVSVVRMTFVVPSVRRSHSRGRYDNNARHHYQIGPPGRLRFTREQRAAMPEAYDGSGLSGPNFAQLHSRLNSSV